jgi:hypothetical protein
VRNGPDLRTLSDRWSDPAFIARHGHRPFMLLMAVQFIILPATVAAVVSTHSFYLPWSWAESGFAWFAFAFMGNWILGNGFSLGVLFAVWLLM